MAYNIRGLDSKGNRVARVVYCGTGNKVPQSYLKGLAPGYAVLWVSIGQKGLQGGMHALLVKVVGK